MTFADFSQDSWRLASDLFSGEPTGVQLESHLFKAGDVMCMFFSEQRMNQFIDILC